MGVTRRAQGSRRTGLELTGFVEAAARDGLPAHGLERGLWPCWLRLGHELQARYLALTGDGDCGETPMRTGGQAQPRVADEDGRFSNSTLSD
jgi:hypothetical protein